MIEVTLSALLSCYCYRYNVRIFELIEEYGSLVELYALWKSNNVKLPALLQEQLSQAWQEDQMLAMQQQIKKYEITGLVISDTDYPEMLRHIADPPYVLYLRGKREVLDRVCLGCVGTRRVSQYGKRAIGRIIPSVSRYPLSIVSGLALGIDAEAHRAALACGLPTIAVLAAGLDRFEPTTNSGLAEQILKQGGCIISEYPPFVRPQKHHFLERNRIVAGICSAVVVVEGKEHSGSLVTARYALNYGREVGVVPGDIFLENTQGPLRLLRDGAWPIAEGGDIVAMLSLEENHLDASIEVVGAVAETLRGGPATLDSLCQKLNWPIGQVQAELTRLELEGEVECLATGAYYLKR